MEQPTTPKPTLRWFAFRNPEKKFRSCLSYSAEEALADIRAVDTKRARERKSTVSPIEYTRDLALETQFNADLDVALKR